MRTIGAKKAEFFFFLVYFTTIRAFVQRVGEKFTSFKLLNTAKNPRRVSPGAGKTKMFHVKQLL